MIDEELLDIYFYTFTNNINKWLPEGFTEIDLALLQKYNLLDFSEESATNRNITHFFHMIESEEKLTLFNEQFIIWIVPDPLDEIPTTYTLIAILQENQLHLEVGFQTRGVYNTSHFLLNFLEHFLQEIQENEETLNQLKKTT